MACAAEQEELVIVRDRRHYLYLDHPASPTTRTAEVEARSKRHICAGTAHHVRLIEVGVGAFEERDERAAVALGRVDIPELTTMGQ